MKVRRNTLLLIAALVWSAAGFNILRIGLLACPPYRTIVNYLLSAVVFTVFQIFIFGRLVNKHTGPHQRLRGGAALLPQVFRCEVLHHDGSDDDRRHLAAVQQRGPGLVHPVFLHRTGRLPPAGGTAVRLQLRQGGPRRQGQGVISEIRPAWSSFGITVSKLLFFVGKIAS